MTPLFYKSSCDWPLGLHWGRVPPPDHRTTAWSPPPASPSPWRPRLHFYGQRPPGTFMTSHLRSFRSTDHTHNSAGLWNSTGCTHLTSMSTPSLLHCWMALRTVSMYLFFVSPWGRRKRRLFFFLLIPEPNKPFGWEWNIFKNLQWVKLSWLYISMNPDGTTWPWDTSLFSYQFLSLPTSFFLFPWCASQLQIFHPVSRKLLDNICSHLKKEKQRDNISLPLTLGTFWLGQTVLTSRMSSSVSTSWWMTLKTLKHLQTYTLLFYCSAKRNNLELDRELIESRERSMTTMATTVMTLK